MSNIAVVGSGYWGKNLVRNFNDLGALIAICDKDSSVLDNFKEKHEGISTTENLDYLLDESVFQIDAVAIATPAATHYNLAKKCLVAGKHVFVEKPLALTEEEGQDLIEIAEKNHLTLMVGNPAKQKGWM